MDDWKDKLATLLGDMPTQDSNDNSTNEPASDNNAETRPKKLPRLNYFYEKKGRAGKPATIITGFDGMSDNEVAEIASRLKQRLGCGGSARGGEILLQGDRRESAKRIIGEFF